MGTIVKLYEENPDPDIIAQVVECLLDGGIIIYPTDTLYGIGCMIDRSRQVEQILQMKEVRPRDVKLSFVCSSIAQISKFALLDKDTFKLLHNLLPGPYTFVLPAMRTVPPYFVTKRKTVGVRIPDNRIPCRIVEALDRPIMSTSLPAEDDPGYHTDPTLMYERWGHQVDMVIDGGIGGTEPSTVVDCTGPEPSILRHGKGQFSF